MDDVDGATVLNGLVASDTTLRHQVEDEHGEEGKKEIEVDDQGEGTTGGEGATEEKGDGHGDGGVEPNGEKEGDGNATEDAK